MLLLPVGCFLCCNKDRLLNILSIDGNKDVNNVAENRFFVLHFDQLPMSYLIILIAYQSFLS